MKVSREGNKPLLLQIFTGIAVMALLVLTALGNALLMLVVALALLIVGFMVFGRARDGSSSRLGSNTGNHHSK